MRRGPSEAAESKGIAAFRRARLCRIMPLRGADGMRRVPSEAAESACIAASVRGDGSAGEKQLPSPRFSCIVGKDE